MDGSAVTAAGLFLEGLLSFFTPCVLPLVPLYLGYLTAGLNPDDPHHRRKTFLLTLCFVMGISVVFLIAGLGSSALQVFFRTYRLQFLLVGGFLLLVLGLMSLGVIHIPLLERDYRIPGFQPGKSSAPQAFLLGFFFSFAWSPCIGPLLASAIVAASAAPSQGRGILYLLAYAAGFIIPFLIVGLFADAALSWLKKHRNIVKYTGIIGGLVVTGMGLYMLWDANGTILRMQKREADAVAVSEQSTGLSEDAEEAEVSADTQSEEGKPDAQKYNFTLKDAEGAEHSLTDYVGEPVLINFFGTWCYYCNVELPKLQEIHEQGDVKVLLIAAPGANGEGSIEYIEKYMKDAGYTMEILYDETGEVSLKYGISGYPTTFALQKDGNFLGYMPGYMPDDVTDDVVAQLTDN